MKKQPLGLFLNVKNNIELNDSDEEEFKQLSVGKKPEFKNQINQNTYNNHTTKGISWDASTKKCSRDQQCDRFSIQNPLRPSQKESFFAVFDGHFSDEVPEYLQNNLHDIIIKNSNYNDKSTIQQAFKQAFQQADNNIIQDLKLKGGSTALVSIIIDQQLYIINVGDSLSKMYKTNSEIIELNRRHEVSDELERKKLEEKGAYILDRGKIQRINGRLAVSRSFGDSDYKQYITSEPDIYLYDIQQDDQFLMLASDGFWENMNDEKIQKEIKLYQQQQQKNGNQDNIQEQQDSNPQAISRNLLNIASDMTGSTSKKDNMTLVMIDIQSLMKEYQQQNKNKKLNNININPVLNVQNNQIYESDAEDRMSTEQPKQQNQIKFESCGKITPEINNNYNNQEEIHDQKPNTQFKQFQYIQDTQSSPVLSVNKNKIQSTFSFEQPQQKQQSQFQQQQQKQDDSQQLDQE